MAYMKKIVIPVTLLVMSAGAVHAADSNTSDTVRTRADSTLENFNGMHPSEKTSEQSEPTVLQKSAAPTQSLSWAAWFGSWWSGSTSESRAGQGQNK